MSDREVTAAEADLLDRAEHVLIGECMRARGFPYVVPPRNPADTDKTFPYVVDDPEWAALYGFGGLARPSLGKLRDSDPNRRYLRSQSPPRQQAFNAALAGPNTQELSVRLPGGGTVVASDSSCIAIAKQRLYRDLHAWFRADTISINLRPLYVPKVTQDPEYVAATRQWARCMRAGGLHYDTPDELREALPGVVAGMTAADAQAAERRLAVAEANCARRTPLAATAVRLDRLYSDLARAEYRSELDTKRRLQLAALPRARQLVRSTR